MKRIFLFFSLFAIIHVSLFGQQVKVGIYQNSPKVFTDKNGEAQGIFIDILNEIARKEKLEIVYIHDSWSNHLKNIQNGTIDLLTDVAFVEARDSIFSFNTIPVIQSWIQIFCKKGTPVFTIQDLENRTIGVLNGSVQHDFLIHEFPQSYDFPIHIKVYEDYETSVNALEKGSIDAILASRFFYFSDLRTENIVPTSIVFNSGDLYFATLKGHHLELLQIIDKHLSEMKNDPGSVYYTSLDRWLRENPKLKIPQSLIFFLIFLLGALTLVVFHVIILKKRIRIKTQELQKAIKNIEENERNYREIFNSSRDGIYIHDYNTGEILDVNQTVLDMFGYDSMEQISSLPPDKIFDIEGGFTPEAAYKKIEETRNKGQCTFEWRGKRKDGSIFALELSLVTATIGGTVRILAFARNIDDKKRMEKEAESATALFHTLAMNSPVGIFRTDTLGDTTFVNPAWCRMTSVMPEEAMGSAWLQRVHPDDRNRIVKEWKERVRKRVPSRAEYRLMRNDGTIVWVLGYAVPDFLGSQFNGYVGTMTDVTELKEAEINIQKTNEDLRIAKEKAEESNKLKSSFLANLSHEIRTPMNSIAGFAALLEESAENSENVRKFSAIIRQSTNQLLSIINDIVEISLIETGQMSIRYEEIEIGAFFSHLQSIYNNQIPEDKDIEILFNIPEAYSICAIYTDRVKFEQILINLINNAIKYTEKGHIIIDCKQVNNEQLIFSVSDTGIGIDPSEHNLVFERFYRCENEHTTELKGSGLGLSIMKAYVEMLGGYVSLESSPGKGSKFYFSHPFHSYTGISKPENANNNETREQLTSQPKILIVDDEELNVLFLQNALSEYQAEITVTSRSDEAVEMCKTSHFHLVFMDVKLTDGSGIDATKEIKQFAPHLPVIIQTAYALPEDEQKARDAGCDDFIAKPISLKKLKSIVENFLQKN